MQIVIDIDDNLYTRLFDNGVDNYDDAVDMAKAIRNGTVLPEHGRLGDLDALIKRLLPKYFDWLGEGEQDDFSRGNNSMLEEVVEAIKEFPTIIEATRENNNADSNRYR